MSTEQPDLKTLIEAADAAERAASEAAQAALDQLQVTARSVSRAAHHWWAARALAAERELGRLRAQAEPSEAASAAPEPLAEVSGCGQREFDLQYLEGDRWQASVLSGDRQSAVEASIALDRARRRHPDAQWRIIARHLPTFEPLTDAELDALVLAEDPEATT